MSIIAATLWRPRTVRLVGATVLLVVGQVVTWFLLRSQGGTFVGDQVHYLIAGQALSHVSLHPLPYYQKDFLTHYLYNWPTNASVTDHGIVQTFPGPHGSVFAHGIGLPLLLSPFIAVGSVPLAMVGFFTLNASAFVWLHQRASDLAQLSARGRIVGALALAPPAMWLAATQVYPDLISGVMLAIALVELALIERHARWPTTGAIVVALTLGFVPWLQVKNLVPALFILIATGALALRHQSMRRMMIITAVIVISSWALLFTYNEFFFANSVGLPQPNPTFDLSSLSNSLALLFDRHQGLFVQIPTVIIGAIGLWFSRRSIPLASVTAVIAVLSVLVINGTYTTSVPFGGVALAGRFEWTISPMLLAWVPFTLARIEPVRVRIIALGCAIAVMWSVQGLPILLGHHLFFNETFAPFAPWDPTLYPGWWPGLSQTLPAFLSPGIHLASTWTHLLAELIILGLLALVVLRMTRTGPLSSYRWLSAIAALSMLAGLVVAIGPGRDLPQTTLAWPGSNLGAPWAATAQAATFAPIPLVDVGPGTYRATITYAVVAEGNGSSAASLLATALQRPVVSHWLNLRHLTDGATVMSTAAPIDLTGVRSATVLFHRSDAMRQLSVATVTLRAVRDSLLFFRMHVGAGASVSVQTLRLAKVAT
jgi:hypothetical protein